MKEGWEYKTLGECCDILNGYPFKSSLYSNSGIRVIRITNVQKGYVIDSNPKYYPESKISEISNFILNNEDLLISLTGNVGRVAILQKEFLPAALNQRVACLRIKDMIVNKKFLFFYLNNDLFEKLCIKNSTGAAQLNMSTVWLKKQIIPIPSYDEQRRIVSYLDSSFKSIDEIKDKALKSLTEAKALFQSALAEAMEPKEGWEYKKIYEVGQVVGGTTPSTNNPNYWNGDLCWISPAELTGNHYLYDSRKKITQEAVNSKSLKLLPVGTVILSSRAPIGKVTINKVPTYCNQGFKCVICKDSLYNEYLYWWFYGHTKFLNSLGTGATFAEISKKVVENIIITIPSIDEQSQIVSRLDFLSSKVRAIEEKYQRIVAECDAMKQAMLREVFE